jgi:glycosyltransferase involved in cell wall biosynthesis
VEFVGHVPVKFSIVTPTLNRADYLRECIESVFEQGYEDVEHVIVDGGSTDGTVSMLESLNAHYGNRIRWISEPDHGISDGVNKAFQMVTGDVVNWIGSDDKLAKGALSTVAQYFDEHREARWIYGSYDMIDERGTFLKRRQATGFSYSRFLRSGYICGPSLFVKTELLRQVGPVRVDLLYAMDFEWCLRMAGVAEPHKLDPVLTYFRWHPGSVSMGRRMVQLDEGLAISLAYARSTSERARLIASNRMIKTLAWARRLAWRFQLNGSHL